MCDSLATRFICWTVAERVLWKNRRTHIKSVSIVAEADIIVVGRCTYQLQKVLKAHTITVIDRILISEKQFLSVRR